jgi:CBS domain-containing protein
MDLRSAMQLMVGRGILGLPVVDDSERPIGMISETDLLRDQFVYTSQQEPSPTSRRTGTVADLMTPFVFSLPDTATVGQAAALMVYEGIHRIPVISADNRLVGIVSPLDILSLIATLAGFRNPRLPRP